MIKKILLASLFVITAVVFLMPGVSKASTVYFWSSNLFDQVASPSLRVGSSWWTSDVSFLYWQPGFANQDFSGVNFVDLNVTGNPNYNVSRGSDVFYLNVCSIPTGGYWYTFSKCSGGGSMSLATSSGRTLSDLVSSGAATSTWSRFTFASLWSWDWSTTTKDLVIYLRCVSPTNTQCGNSDELYLPRVSPGSLSYSDGRNYLSGVLYNNGDVSVRVGNQVVTTIQRPVNGLYASPAFPMYSLQLADGLATTTLKAVVRYGHIGSGSYQYDTSASAYIYSSNIGNLYSVSSDNCDANFVSGCTDYTAGTQGLSPVTWYAQAYVFSDCIGDGSFDCLVDTSPEISFVYYPGSTLFQGQSATSTGNYINVYSSSTTCPSGIVCTATNGTQFYIDENGNVVTVQSTSTAGTGRWEDFYNIWQPLRYKFPWGYVTSISDLIQGLATSTATSTWYLLSTSTSEWLSSASVASGLDAMRRAGTVISPVLYPIRLITDGVMWLGTGYVIIKLFVFML